MPIWKPHLFYRCILQPLFLLATGSNENANGLLREFFPKGTDFAQMTDEALCRVLDLISHRPRKCLGWRMKKEAATKGPGNAKPLDAASFVFLLALHSEFIITLSLAKHLSLA